MTLTVQRVGDDVLDLAADPATSTDATIGFRRGSRVRNTATGKLWSCTDATAGTAKWVVFPQSTDDLPEGTANRYYTDARAAAAAPVQSNDSRLSDQRTPTDGSVTAAKVAGSLKPSGSATATDEALRALGTTASTAAAGNDGRLSDQRVPTDGSVTAAKVSDALKPSVSAAATDESLRALGTTGSTAAAGNDPRLSDARTPTAHASSHAPGAADSLNAAYMDLSTNQTVAGQKTYGGLQVLNGQQRFGVTALTSAAPTIQCTTGTVEYIADLSAGALSAVVSGANVTGHVVEVRKTDNSLNALTLPGTYSGIVNPTVGFPNQVFRFITTGTAGQFFILSNTVNGIAVPLYRQHLPNRVDNTAVETDIFGTGKGYGSLSIPSGSWVAGMSLFMACVEAVYGTPVAPGGVGVRPKANGVTLALATVTASVLATSSTTNWLGGWARITCESVSGTTARLRASGCLLFQTAATATVMVPYSTADSVRAGTVTATTGSTTNGPGFATVDVPNNSAGLATITSLWTNAQAGQGQTVYGGTLTQAA